MIGRLIANILVAGRIARSVAEVCQGDHLTVEESRAPDDIVLDVAILPTTSRMVFEGSTMSASLLTTAVVWRVMVQTPYTVPDSSDTSEAFVQTGGGFRMVVVVCRVEEVEALEGECVDSREEVED
ncbi:hypothetical protein Y032_0729g1894 [Ancylostoma ceylanicum]|uniref:Uncharacterized protein n=1 Tax=Ancylostoma ceylanicum TaxID=53326 RepID=A0A016WF50_9BILA|nr:hypothetical protein Y032_0729g1894 [Ancylostoma ceylanicum]